MRARREFERRYRAWLKTKLAVTKLNEAELVSGFTLERLRRIVEQSETHRENMQGKGLDDLIGLYFNVLLGDKDVYGAVTTFAKAKATEKNPLLK